MVPDLLVLGVPIVGIVPALVELMKRQGLPTQFAGLAAIGAAALVLGLVELRVHPVLGGWAAWLLAAIVYGLASAGLYSQVQKLTGR
jgi:hypothetical protein